MTPRLQGALLLVGVFALGAVTGGGVVRSVAQHRRALLDDSPLTARREAILGMLRRKVGLDHKQVEAVRSILNAHESEFVAINRTIAPQMGALRHQVFSEMRVVLREDQKLDLDRVAARLDRLTYLGDSDRRAHEDAGVSSAQPTPP